MNLFVGPQNAIEILRWAAEIVVERKGFGRKLVLERKIDAAGARMHLITDNSMFDVLVSSAVPIIWLSESRQAFMVPTQGYPLIVSPLYVQNHKEQ